MRLHFQSVVSRLPGTRSHRDQRYRVTRIIASYRGDDGHEYRKSFESRCGDPAVPSSGTHEELNAAQYQWK